MGLPCGLDREARRRPYYVRCMFVLVHGQDTCTMWMAGRVPWKPRRQGCRGLSNLEPNLAGRNGPPARACHAHPWSSPAADPSLTPSGCCCYCHCHCPCRPSHGILGLGRARQTRPLALGSPPVFSPNPDSDQLGHPTCWNLESVASFRLVSI